MFRPLFLAHADVQYELLKTILQYVKCTLATNDDVVRELLIFRDDELDKRIFGSSFDIRRVLNLLDVSWLTDPVKFDEFFYVRRYGYNALNSEIVFNVKNQPAIIYSNECIFTPPVLSCYEDTAKNLCEDVIVYQINQVLTAIAHRIG